MAVALACALVPICMTTRTAQAQWVYAKEKTKTVYKGEMLINQTAGKGALLAVRCKYDKPGMQLEYFSSKLAFTGNTANVPVTVAFDGARPIAGVTWRFEGARKTATVASGMKEVMDAANRATKMRVSTVDPNGVTTAHEFMLAGLTDGLARLTCK